MQLNKSYTEDIERICRAADDFLDEGNTKEAYRKYKEALDIIPNPKTSYETATWIFVSIGDLFFKNKQYDMARDYFFEARQFLLRAYMLVGDDIFWDEDQKYYDVIKDLVKTDDSSVC